MQTITTDHRGKQRGMKSSQQQHEVDEQLNYSYSKGVAVNKERQQQSSAYGNTEQSRNGKEGPVIQKNRSSQSLQGQMVRNDSVTSSKKNLMPPSVQTTIVSQSNHGVVIQYPLPKTSNQIPKKAPIKHQLPVTISPQLPAKYAPSYQQSTTSSHLVSGPPPQLKGSFTTSSQLPAHP